MDLYRLFLRIVATRARVVGLGLFGAMLVVQAVFIRRTSSGSELAAQLVRNVDLPLLIPVIALVFAGAALGDLTDDSTLVYLWMRPVGRARIVFSALAAVLTIALPLALLPTMATSMILFGTARTTLAGALACALATVAYATLFLGLGLRIRRALPWGLAYILVWEGAVARAARGAARLSVQVHASSLFAHLSRSELPRFSSSTAVAIVVPVLATVVAVGMTVRWLSRIEVA